MSAIVICWSVYLHVHSMVDSIMTIHFICRQILNTCKTQIFTPILVFAMVILWYLAEASKDEPPRPVGLGNNVKNYNYIQVKTVRPIQNRYKFICLKKAKFDGTTLTLMVMLSDLPFLCPIATAMSIALNPESDSMVGSAPLSIKWWEVIFNTLCIAVKWNDFKVSLFYLRGFPHSEHDYHALHKVMEHHHSGNT